METPSTAPTCRTCPLSVESPQILKIQISSLSNWNLLNQKQTRAKLHVWKTEFPLSAAVASITIALPAQLCPSVCFQNLFSAFFTCLLRTRLLSFLTGRPHFQRNVRRAKTPSCVSNKTSVPLWKNAFMTTVQRTTQTWAVCALFFCNFIRLFLPESSWQISFFVTAVFWTCRQTVKYNKGGFHWSTPDQSGLWAVIDSL